MLGPLPGFSGMSTGEASRCQGGAGHWPEASPWSGWPSTHSPGPHRGVDGGDRQEQVAASSRRSGAERTLYSVAGEAPGGPRAAGHVRASVGWTGPGDRAQVGLEDAHRGCGRATYPAQGPSWPRGLRGQCGTEDGAQKAIWKGAVLWPVCASPQAKLWGVPMMQRTTNLTSPGHLQSEVPPSALRGSSENPGEAEPTPITCSRRIHDGGPRDSPAQPRPPWSLQPPPRVGSGRG